MRSKYYFGIGETSKGALLLSFNWPQIGKQEECPLFTQSSPGGGAGPDDLGLKGLSRAGQVLGGATQQAAQVKIYIIRIVNTLKMLGLVNLVVMAVMLAKLMVFVLTKLHRKPFFVLFVLFALYPLTGMYDT